MQGAVEQILASRAALCAKNPGLLGREAQHRTLISAGQRFERQNPFQSWPLGLHFAQRTPGCWAARPSAEPLISAGLRSERQNPSGRRLRARTLCCFGMHVPGWVMNDCSILSTATISGVYCIGARARALYPVPPSLLPSILVRSTCSLSCSLSRAHESVGVLVSGFVFLGQVTLALLPGTSVGDALAKLAPHFETSTRVALAHTLGMCFLPSPSLLYAHSLFYVEGHVRVCGSPLQYCFHKI